MASTKCGFNDTPLGLTGSQQLVLFGPTILVDIGFDPSHTLHSKTRPAPGMVGLTALVDTGASESCIDNLLAAALGLPIVDRQPIAGSSGQHVTNIYQAQVFIPSLGHTILGRFAGVDLIAGSQAHQALIGRTFLQNFRMSYNGKTGTVTLTSL